MTRRMRAVLVGCGLLCAVPATASGIDVSGPWRVESVAPRTPSAPPVRFSCDWHVTQAGSSLEIVEDGCTDGFAGGTYTGTIDPNTGSLSVSGAADGCPDLAGTGATKPSGSVFSIAWTCAAAGTHGSITGSRCENGQIDPGEQCDDGPHQPGSCCSPKCQFDTGAVCLDDGNACTLDVCDANGVCTHPVAPSGRPCPPDADPCTSDVCDGAGTCVHQPFSGPCDDGNDCTVGDQCVAGVCAGAPKPAGGPCDADHDQCTVDACDGAGACVIGSCSPCCTPDPVLGCVATPALSCETPLSAGSLVIVKKSQDGTDDSLVWLWRRGTQAAYPDPQTNDYTFCLYASQDGSPDRRLLVDATAPAAADCGGVPCWRQTPREIDYKDTTLSHDGLRLIKLKIATEGKAKIKLQARGDRLGVGDLPVTFPIFVQLRTPKECWETRFPFQKNDSATLLKAK